MSLSLPLPPEAPFWRRALFTLVFYAGSVVIVGAVPLFVPFGQAAMIRHARRWTRWHGWAARTLLGIRTRVEGTIPPGPVLFAAKHEAMYETLELERLLDGPAVVLKRELSRIPLWGWATRVYGAIAVEREASSAALRALVAEAQVARGAGRSVIVYPEGTRVPHGEAPPLRSGLAGLYKALGYPVVPIALDSGRFLPRRGSFRAGTVTVRIGEPIPPGLPRRQLEARVHAGINALNAGLAEGAPVPPSPAD